MSVRRDQVDAQKYVNRRLVNALLTSDPNAAESPLRSIGRATFASVVLGGLILLGFLGYGFVSRGGATDWQQEGSVVVARETGTRFVYLDGLLHPVANLTSAHLIAGGPEVVYVSENSIADAPRGEPLGIVGAPDAVPAATDLVHDDWTTCTAVVELPTGRRVPSVRVAPGAPGLATPLPADVAVLVSVDGEPQLVWDGARWPIAELSAVLTAFNQAGAEPVPVGAAWANAVPAGRGRLGLPVVPQRGEPAGLVGGEPSSVGQVYVVEAADEDRQYFLAYPDGLLPVSDPVAALVLADPATIPLYDGQRVRAIPLDAATVNAAGLSSAEPVGRYLPAVVPDLLNESLGRSAGLCATYELAGSPSPELGVVDPLALGVPDDDPLALGDYAVADRVALEPGHAALVETVVPGGAPGTVFLISDQGVKHPIPGPAALDALGYGDVEPDRFSRLLLDAIPTGPSLDPADALRVLEMIT